MKRQKIVTFGELLLRFSKPDHLRLSQGDLFTSKFGGSEANVAVSLATQGEDVTYITRLPDTPVGHAGAMCLAQLGVDTSHRALDWYPHLTGPDTWLQHVPLEYLAVG